MNTPEPSVHRESSPPELHQDPPLPEWSDAALDAEPVLGHRGMRRLGWIAVAVLVVVLLAVLPPLINVRRYQHRVAQAISDSIGRPVHFDDVHVHLLPLPGLTIDNFVVQEDPAFGVEPAMRANTVQARLRLASLWRRRVEVLRIVLEAPSINLVRRADGRWNLQGIVSQAGTLQSAPTAQQRAGAQPRFPYVEATNARVNVKIGETKLPWSLVDAKLALWLPDATEWRVRLSGRPLRTDTDVSDVGELHLEGSLGRDTTGAVAGSMNQPLAVSARWESTPLGETAKLLLGRDTGFRGAASAELEVRGTPAQMHLTSDLHLHNLRRAEFVPRLPMSVDAHCEAEAMGVLHQVRRMRCGIPTAQSAGLFEGVFRSRDEHVTTAPDVLSLTADVPNLLDPATSTATLDLKDAKPGYFLNWLRVFSNRIPEGEKVDGKVSIHAAWNAPESPASLNLGAVCTCELPSTSPAASESASDARAVHAADAPWVLTVSHTGTAATGGNATLAITASQHTALSPGQDVPAMPAVDGVPAISGQISRSGLTLRYASADVAQFVARLLPALGDGMPAVTANRAATALQSERVWSGPQQWTVAPAAPAPAVRRKRHR